MGLHVPDPRVARIQNGRKSVAIGSAIVPATVLNPPPAIFVAVSSSHRSAITPRKDGEGDQGSDPKPKNSERDGNASSTSQRITTLTQPICHQTLADCNPLPPTSSSHTHLQQGCVPSSRVHPEGPRC